MPQAKPHLSDLAPQKEHEISDFLKRGLAFHREGRIKAAADLYEKILNLSPNHFDALHLLGVVFLQTGKHLLALQLFDRALSLNSYSASLYSNRGLSLHSLRRYEEALSNYDKAITLKPDFAEAHYNLGNTFHAIKKFDDALQSFDCAIRLNSGYAVAYDNRGNTLQALGRYQEALASHEQAIRLRGHFENAYLNRGNALKKLERYNEALLSYIKCIELCPDNAEAWFLHGNTLSELKKFDDALVSYKKSLAICPNNAGVHCNLGNALKDLKRFDEAIAAYDNAIALKPEFAESYSNRGVALHELNLLNEALIYFDKAISLRPSSVEVLNNRANVLKDLGRFAEAMVYYDKAISFKNDYSRSHWNKSLLLIMKGYFMEGWKLYEYGINLDNARGFHYAFPKISWRGQESIEGKTILIHSEQGFGDVIQFCRYIPLVKSLGAEIVFEVPKPLLSFLSTLDCDMTVISRGDPHPQFDAYCPIMSLPYAFKTTVETIPAQVPYLYPDQKKRNNWINRLGAKYRLRVGIVWSGSTAHQNDKNRSIPLNLLTPLFQLPVEWHSLQKEYREADLRTLEQHTQICRHESHLEDFSDTAALVACMDLIISVDTSVAHVAGSIGIPVWIMLPWVPDYRWMLDRNDSPWYPTAKLFRQSLLNDWNSVVVSVKCSLLTQILSSG